MSATGVHFRTNDEHLLTELSRAVRVFLEGLEQLSLDEGNEVVLSPHLSCEGRGEASWRKGDKFFRSVKLHYIRQSNAVSRERRKILYTYLYFIIIIQQNAFNVTCSQQ